VSLILPILSRQTIRVLSTNLLQTVNFGAYTDKAAVPGVSRNDLHREPMVCPPAKAQECFAATVHSLCKRHSANQSESNTLGVLRDTLLPKLLSGVIRITDAETFGRGGGNMTAGTIFHALTWIGAFFVIVGTIRARNTHNQTSSRSHSNLVDWIGPALVLVGSVGAYFTNQSEGSQLKGTIESLESKNAAIKEDTGEIRSLLRERYPGQSTSQAVAQLRRDLDKTIELAQSYDYRPLTPDLRQSVVTQLSQFGSLLQPKQVTVVIDVVAGDNNSHRTKLVDEIKDVLVESGIATRIAAPQLHFGGGPRSPISVRFHPRNKESAERLLRSLQPLIGTPATGYPSEEAPLDEIYLRLSGAPRFKLDGSVILK